MELWQILSAIFGFAAPFGSQWLNQPQVDAANQREQERRGEGRDIITGVMRDIQAKPSLLNFDVTAGGQTFNLGGPPPGIFQEPGLDQAPGVGIPRGGAFNLDFDEMFGFAGPSSEDVFRSAQTGATDPGSFDPSGFAFTPNLPQLTAGSLFNQIDFPAGDFDARQSAQLGALGQTSARREALGREQAISSGFARGQGLQEITGSAIAGLERQEDIGRGLGAQNIRAGIETQKQALDIARAQTQAGLASTEAGINRDLAIAAQQLLGKSSSEQLTSAQSGFEFGVTQGDRRSAQLAGLSQFDRQAGFNEKANSLNALLAFLGLGQQEMTEENRLALMAAFEEAGILTGTEDLVQFSGDALTQGVQSVFQQIPLWMQSDQPDQKQGFSALSFGYTCVDGNAVIHREDGPRLLKTVKVGDRVLGADGGYHEVVETDYGSVPEEHRNGHVQIATNLGSLKLTVDHSVDGRRADEWKEGDLMETMYGEALVVSVKPCKYVHSGDLLLEDNADYVADVFLVESNIGKNKALEQAVEPVGV